MNRFLAARGVAVLIVGPGALEEAIGYHRRLALPFPVLADRHGVVRRSYGFRRRFVVIPECGVVLVDRQGTVRYVRRTTDARLAFDERELLDAVEALGRRETRDGSGLIPS